MFSKCNGLWDLSVCFCKKRWYPEGHSVFQETLFCTIDPTSRRWRVPSVASRAGPGTAEAISQLFDSPLTYLAGWYFKRLRGASVQCVPCPGPSPLQTSSPTDVRESRKSTPGQQGQVGAYLQCAQQGVRPLKVSAQQDVAAQKFCVCTRIQPWDRE